MGAWRDNAVATIRMPIWEQSDGNESLRDIREQEVDMGWPAFYEDDDRVAHFFAALGVVFAEVVAKDMETVETLMPSDLVHPEVLKLKRAVSQQDFEAALRARSRLGKYL